MSISSTAYLLAFLLAAAGPGDGGNRLAYLDEPASPYWPGLPAPRLVTPQWIGEEDVDAVVVLAIDDMRDAPAYETYLRPILERLKKIGGRAPVSIMASHVDLQNPVLKQWITEGLSVEAHTLNHPCPLLQGGDLAKAKADFDGCIDLLTQIDGQRVVGFRMPCCDSMSSVSPRFFSEIFAGRTPAGNFLAVDSSVFNLFTPADPALTRGLVIDDDGRQKFRKYIPADRRMANFIENYPYPYVVARLCWECPATVPSDWEGHNVNGSSSPETLADMKAAFDATLAKQGMYVLCFHPHGWMKSEQVIELIDHAVRQSGNRVRFLTLGEVHGRLTKNALGGHPLRAEGDGGDNGVRLLDLNCDGYMDVVIGNDVVRQTRIWRPKHRNWTVTDFPAAIASAGSDGRRHAAGACFGVLRPDGYASVLVRNENTAGLWHFDGQHWSVDSKGLAGLDGKGPVFTSRNGRDGGVRLLDLDRDGACELIVGNPKQSGVFAWEASMGWKRLPFRLPDGTSVVDAEGHDVGLRFFDPNVDGHPDVVFANEERYCVHAFVSMTEGWSCELLRGTQAVDSPLPPIARADGSNNGVWLQFNHLWTQNEDTGGAATMGVEMRHITALLGTDREPPARSPADSLRSMVVADGFQVELVAHEPMVVDPVDIAWGPDGKTWVVEYRDYPLGLENKGIPCGRIKLLEDDDGDGHFERSSVFLDKVHCPMGVMVWRRGIIVTAAPEIFYAEDTDGDGVADHRKTLFSGFGVGNHQHRVNHPRWGLDNWVHAANGDSGGRIKSAQTGDEVEIDGRDLRFKPDEGRIEPQLGQTQFGTNRDDWGNWFGCNNSNQGWLYALADHYLRRNPHLAPPPGRIDVASDRTAYPIGRVISHCDLKFRPYAAWGKPGRWTSVAGVTIYRDALFGPHYQGNLFVNDSVYNVIHRRILTPEGIAFRGERGPDEQESEFLASHDVWFRPSTQETGPDGALWVLDMYRFVIEHPQWIDDELEKMLDLRAGSDKGRIYRVYPVDKAPRRIPRLDRLDAAGLVTALDSPNGWQRDMAHQMLLWRGGREAAPSLEAMVLKSARPEARAHALCVLDGLGLLRPATAVRALADPHAGVRRHAIRTSEPLLDRHATVGPALLKLENDADPFVLMQLAYSLGEWKDPRAGALLGRKAVRHAGEPYLTAAVMSSAVPHLGPMLAAVVADPTVLRGRADLVANLVNMALAEKHVESVAGVVRAIAAPVAGSGAGARSPFAPWQFLAVRRLLDGLDRQAAALVALRTEGPAELRGALDGLAALFNAARTLAVDERAALPERVAAVGILGRGFDLQDDDCELMADLLVAQTPLELQVAAVDALGRLRREDVPERLLAGWPERGPKLNGAVFDALLSRPEWAGALLDEIQTNSALAVALGTTRRQVFLSHPSETVRQRAEKLLGKSTTSDQIQARLKKYAPVLDLAGDTARGKTIFVQTTCGDCHLLDGVGNQIATDLTTLVDKSPGALLVAMVDPNRAVEDKYLQYTAVTVDGRMLTGMLLEETTNSITLADVAGKKYTILRKDLEELVSTGRSHMPELLEERMDFQQMADLFAFIGGTGPPRNEYLGNQPATLHPDERGVVTLRAADASVYGPDILFEQKYRNLGLWYRSEAYAAWTLEIEKGGAYDVWLDWACDNSSAGNRFIIQAGPHELKGSVPSTGSWDNYRFERFGQMMLETGSPRLTFRSEGPIRHALIDLRTIKLAPAGSMELVDIAPPGMTDEPGTATTEEVSSPAEAEPSRIKELVPVRPATDGALHLTAAAGRGVGPKIKYMPKWKAFGWFTADDRVDWRIDSARKGPYEVWLEWSVADNEAGKSFVLEVGDSALEGTVGRSGSWETYKRARVGVIALDAGVQQVVFRPKGEFAGALLDLREIVLLPAPRGN